MKFVTNIENTPGAVNPYTRALRSKFDQQRKFYRFFYSNQLLTRKSIILVAAASIVSISSLLLSDAPNRHLPWFLIGCWALALTFSLVAFFRNGN